MNRTKYIIIASAISLVILLVSNYVITVNVNKDFVNIPIAINNVEPGEKISLDNIRWTKIDISKVSNEVYITEKTMIDFKDYVTNVRLERGQIVTNACLIKEEEYLEKIEGLQHIAIPIKSATEGVCYKIKKGDKVNVYYTAKKKLVDQAIKDKKKIYSTTTNETLVTCLLYENIEIIATTNNIGQEINGAAITDVVVMLTEVQALELANLKEQGTFTLTII